VGVSRHWSSGQGEGIVGQSHGVARRRAGSRAANLAGALPAGELPGLALLLLAPTHPRYNAFGWETWHELDMLRCELAQRFAAKRP
jgi:hypothetical protein